MPHMFRVFNFVTLKVQEVLDYWDLDYRNPRNIGIYKKIQLHLRLDFVNEAVRPLLSTNLIIGTFY